jgi:peroxiredoxin
MKNIVYIAGVFLLLVSPVWSSGNKEERTASPRNTTAQADTAQADTAQAEGQTAQTEDGPDTVPMGPIQEQLYKIGFEIPQEPFEAPNFTLSTLKGEEISLSDYKGKIIFLNFWATWCPPCRKEMPSMQTLHEQMQGNPFAMIAVNLQEEKPTVEQFITDKGYTFPVLLDSTGEVGGAMYGVQSIPTTYIIGKDGEILARLVGTREWDTTEIKNIFNELL